MAGASGTRTRPPARKAPTKGARGRSRSRSHAAPLVALGRAVAAVWHALARMVGGTARAAGRNAATARELEPEHRRDGAALGVLAFGLITAMAVWFHAAGPVGRVITAICRGVTGNGALVLPLLLVGIGAHMLRQVAQPETRGRVVVGSAALTVSVLGMFDLWAGSPRTAHEWAHAGGVIGRAVGGPLSSGLSAAIAVPLLLVVGAFGVLVVTSTPISALVEYVGGLFRGAPDTVDDALEDA
ncbi:MAG: cell division protein FtsK, partial [Pseudonocardiales bacterium]|nr:cell division protein FtsK [Pseudonocardiales bacterium]